MANPIYADVANLIRDEFSTSFLDNVQKQSTALSAFTRVNMGTREATMPVVATQPEAKFVGYGDADRTKPTSGLGFKNKNIFASEIAVIVPVKEEDIADANADIVGQIIRQGSEAVARTLDAAVLLGIGKPAEWADKSVFEAATAAGNVFQLGAKQDLPGAILKGAEALDVAGNNPDRIIARRGLGFSLANTRNANGSPIYVPSLNQATGQAGEIMGIPYFKDEIGSLDRKKAEALIVDSSKVIIGVRQDLTVKMLDQATVGGISLAENDMVAFRFVMRAGYVLSDMLGAPAAAITPAA